MCILTVTNFHCNCPLRDSTRCPHSNYIRSAAQTPTLPTTPEPTGYYLRRVRDFQRCVRWEPMHGNQVWDHCATFTRDDRLTDPLRCPATVATGGAGEYIRTRHRRDRCEHCTYGHPPVPAGRRNAITSEAPLLFTLHASEGSGEERPKFTMRAGEHYPYLLPDLWADLMGE